MRQRKVELTENEAAPHKRRRQKTAFNKSRAGRCKLCGFRRRGPHHDEGHHHNAARRTDKKGRPLPIGPFPRWTRR